MNIKKSLPIVTASVLILGITLSTFQPAEAGRRGHAVAGIIVGAVALGLLANSHRYNRSFRHYEPVCYRGPVRCVRKWRCWVNRRGYERCGMKRSCWRPEYCE